MMMPASVQWISWWSHPHLSVLRMFARTLRSLGVHSGCLHSVCQKFSLQGRTAPQWRTLLQRRWALTNSAAGCLCGVPRVSWLLWTPRQDHLVWLSLALWSSNLLALPPIPIDIFKDLTSLFSGVDSLNKQGVSDKEATCCKFGQDDM